MRVQEDLTTKKPSMVALVTVIFNEQSTIEDRVKGLLSGEAIRDEVFAIPAPPAP